MPNDNGRYQSSQTDYLLSQTKALPLLWYDETLTLDKHRDPSHCISIVDDGEKLQKHKYPQKLSNPSDKGLILYTNDIVKECSGVLIEISEAWSIRKW